MTREDVRAAMEAIGIIPAIRVSSEQDALFAADAVSSAGIPIVEVTMTVPGALKVIAALVRSYGDIIVGAGTVMDVDTARHCLDAGAKFITATGFDPQVVSFAIGQDVAVFPGALTPSEVAAAWKTGADLVKIFPCENMGGPAYIRMLRRPFPHIPMIAAGGVHQRNAAEFILAGADMLGIGRDLIPPKAIELRQPDRIHELARRYVGIVKAARRQKSGK